MKRVLLFLMAAALGAMAQSAQSPAANPTTITERAQRPTYADLHCAGFLRESPLPRNNYVAAGTHAPHTTRYAGGDTIFIEGGGLQQGGLVSLVRELRDPNRREAFAGQHRTIKKAGQPYADLGRAQVVAVRDGVAVARIEYSCEPVVPGDLAVAYEERTMPTAPETVTLDRFPTQATGATGRIILAKDFDMELGTGNKIYLNLGSGQGIHPGDTFRIVRDYDPDQMDEVDRLSYSASISEDTQHRNMKISKQELKNLPRRTVGEGLVLMTSPSSATAIIIVALEDVLVGDRVELAPATSAKAN